MANHLQNETSPYLLQHANNPVDWYPWGEAALAKARSEHKPIFLSIGYSACHWCHVMEKESFENPLIARILNENFISIKVDREERPDLDSIYMSAVVAMTRSGGWPMSVFLTPDLQPFYGGTYFPPIRRYGMPSFQEVLGGICDAWRTDHDQVVKSAQRLTDYLASSTQWTRTSSQSLDDDILTQATQSLCHTHDDENGGWGSAPKFPQPMALEYLLQRAARGNQEALRTARHALDAMQRGGIYDVVSGGFHRYSTDSQWLIPHFEKMLYDNAQLARVYLHAYQITHDAGYLRTCTQTLDWILLEMRHPAGGFYSSVDADSEGQEGKFYLWDYHELKQILSPESFNVLSSAYNISVEGNFEEKIILQRRGNWDELECQIGLTEKVLIEKLDAIHAQLKKHRDRRSRPFTDDKIIVSWNALTTQAFAEAARVLDRADYLAAAQKNAAFLLSEMVLQGRLHRVWRSGKAHQPAALDDISALILALLVLYQSDFDTQWYQAALNLKDELINQYRDSKGGFFDAPSDVDDLLLRPKELQDNAIPSGNALAVMAQLLLAEYTDNREWHEDALQLLTSLQENFSEHPLAFSQWLQALNFASTPALQIAITWSNQQQPSEDILRYIYEQYLPWALVAGAPMPATTDVPPLLINRSAVNGQTTVYLCQNFTCRLPITRIDQLRQTLVPVKGE